MVVDKYCPGCGYTKPISDYHKNRNAKDGLQYHCTSCRKVHDSRPEKRKQDRERYYLKKDSYLNSYYKRIYGISLAQYREILQTQEGVCAICGDTCISGKQLAVDHDHTTGRVRGLLCTKCNQGLGLFNDNTEILSKAIEYLRMDKYGT